MRELKVPASPPPADAAERRAAKPIVVYQFDEARLNDAALSGDARSGMTKIGEIIVPPREGRAFDVPAGHFFRIVSIEGPQVGDLNLWNAANLSERFFSGKTRALHGTHVSTRDRLWSSLPISGRWRPLLTIGSTGTASTPTGQGCTTSSARAAILIPTGSSTGSTIITAATRT
jgi:uncharacterized protein